MISWKPESDRALLLIIIMTGDLKTFKWPAISAELQEKGFTFTAEACRQHFQKLRREHNSPIATPTKQPRAPQPRSIKKPKATATPTKSHLQSYIDLSASSPSSAHHAGSDDDEDFGFGAHSASPSPMKRKRVMKKEEENGQSAPLFKIEGVEVGGVVDLERDE
ncbi:hypothetical protein LOCC1_G008860 [Lachnellula occidentalis]|uniref:Myb-like domain-containing protein n=1 Tax=Lachnellula occidentalis TaxID=215460 RepID=A0A8H8RJF5_9HELO|nr:hypothetical protein LOCC1_G008860 [Lachnellula occidentalis]